MFWETITYFFLSESKTKCIYQPSCHRKCSFFPCQWMVMSSTIMMLHSVYQGHMPVFSPLLALTPSTLLHSVQNTYNHVKQIDDLVELNFGTLHQLQTIKCTQLTTHLFPFTLPPETPISHSKLLRYFDAYKTDTLPLECAWLEYRSKLDNDNPPPNFDPFHFENLSSPSTTINCFHGANLQSKFSPTAHLTPSPNAVDSILQPSAFLSLSSDKSPIVSDTVASLAITFDAIDFEGPFKNPHVQ